MGGGRRVGQASRIPLLAAALSVILQAPALAQAGAVAAVPRTVLEGFAAGVTEPLFGLYHLAAIVGVGILAGLAARGIVPVIAFGLASIAGVAVQISPANIPADGFFVGLTTLVIGALVLRRQMIRPTVASAIFAFAGLIHGYSMSESIANAGITPIMSYAAGMLLAQTTMGALACAAAIGAVRRPTWLVGVTVAGVLVTLAGGVAAAVGVVG